MSRPGAITSTMWLDTDHDEFSTGRSTETAQRANALGLVPEPSST